MCRASQCFDGSVMEYEEPDLPPADAPSKKGERAHRWGVIRTTMMQLVELAFAA